MNVHHLRQCYRCRRVFAGKGHARFCPDCRRSFGTWRSTLLKPWPLLLAAIGGYLWFVGVDWRVIVLALLTIIGWRQFALYRLHM